MIGFGALVTFQRLNRLSAFHTFGESQTETLPRLGLKTMRIIDNGSIYWTPHTGPMIVHGSIRDVWATLGWERGYLGYPVTDQVLWRVLDFTKDQNISWNLFENGAIATTKDVTGKNVTGVAWTAHVTPEQLRYLVHKAVDIAVHKAPIPP
jgi:hypothetical protein